MKKSVLISLLILGVAYFAITPVKAPIPGPGTQVAIVPDPVSGHGGELPSTDAAYANFTFPNLPWANVNTGNLSSYQIVVLLIDQYAPSPPLSPSQAADLNDWVYNGGKLIIYDSEETPGPDYSWLPYSFNTSNPGGAGATGSLIYMEDNTLGLDNNPASYYYINTTIDYNYNDWEDAIGDANVMTTFDSHWCGDIEVINELEVTGWTHAYAVYGSGLYIYNGFDIDYLGSGTVPDANDMGAVAKIWLLELEQPWGTDYNLPCQRRVSQTVGGEVLSISKLVLLAPFLLILGVAAALTAGFLYRRRIY